jgi:hypothetical protein
LAKFETLLFALRRRSYRSAPGFRDPRLRDSNEPHESESLGFVE